MSHEIDRAFLVVIERTANLLHWAAPHLVQPRGRTSAPHLWAQLSSIFWPRLHPCSLYWSILLNIKPQNPLHFVVLRSLNLAEEFHGIAAKLGCVTRNILWSPILYLPEGSCLPSVTSGNKRFCMFRWQMMTLNFEKKYAVQGFGQHFAPNLNRTFGSAQWKIVRVAELFLWYYHPG